MADEEKKKKKRPLYTTKDELATLEPYQLDTLKAQADRYASKLPKVPPAALKDPSGDSLTSDLAGWVKQAPSAVGDYLKKGFDYWTSSPYRALEAPAQALESISWPVTKLAEIQPFSENLQQAGKNIREKLHSKSVEYGTKAGGYEPSAALGVLGSLKWPWPGPKPIKSEAFLPTKAELGTLGKEVGKGAGAGASYGVLAETDQPPEDRDYLKAVRDWAAIGGAGHAAAGALGARGSRPKPPPAPPSSSHGVVLPDFPPEPRPGDAPKLTLPDTPTDPNWQQPKGPEPPPFMGVTDDLMKQEPAFPPPSRVLHGDGSLPTEPVLPPGQQQRAPLDFGLPPHDVALGEAPSAITHKDFMGSKIPFVKPEELTQQPLPTVGVKPTEPFMGQSVDYLPPAQLPTPEPSPSLPAGKPEGFDLLGQHVNNLEDTVPMTERARGPLHPLDSGDSLAPELAPTRAETDLSAQYPEDVLDVPEVTVRGEPIPKVVTPPEQVVTPPPEPMPSPDELQRMLTQGRPQPGMPQPVQDLFAEAMPGMKPMADYLNLGPIKQAVKQGQTNLAGMPPPEIGAKPHIAREATHDEAPLFSKEAQTPEPEQLSTTDDSITPTSPYGEIHPPDAGVELKEPDTYDRAAIASTPRHNLPAELQDDLLARAMYARDTLGIAGQERGFSHRIEVPGQGGTPEFSSSKSPTFPWYKQVTTEGGMSPRSVETALRKIEEDQGLDTGKYVERVKEALLGDREFAGWKRAGEVTDTPVPHEESLYEPSWEDMDQLADHEGLHTDVSEEVDTDKSMLQKLGDTLNNEKGAVTLGSGVGPLEKSLLTVRRFAEKHPEFQPVYQMALDEGQMATATAHDFRQTAAPYFKLTEQDRTIVDKMLRDRRRLGRPVPIPQQYQGAVQSIDHMMASAYQFINDARSTKGLPPINQDAFYVPFSRSGDYLVILNGPASTTPKWVSAVGTVREGEALGKQLEAKFPGSQALVRRPSFKKGDQPALSFETLQQIERAGFITRDEYDQIIKQFDLPPGYAEHFRQAAKIMGESESLLNPIERYVQATSAYGARFLYDDALKGQINTLKDPQVRQYAEAYRDYLRKKPVEYSRLRGSVAVWDLALNVGSMAQNASQVPALGFPMLHDAVGSVTQAGKIFKDAFAALVKPSPDDLRMLAMAEREGHTRPVNAEELFGTRDIDKTGVEFGAPQIQRQLERGALSPQTARMLRKPVDLLAAGVEHTYDAGQRLNQDLGKRASYALNRLLGHSQPIAQDISEKAHGILMAGFSSIEEMNRKWAMLAGVRAGRHLGMSEPEAYEFAKKFSRDVNFDYSPASRSPLYRGAGAPLGLFATFGTEALSTYSKLIREQLKKPGMGKLAGGAAGTALAAYWSMAGIKGLPGVDDFDVHGPWPGLLSERLPDWAYHGPASAATGLDIASKFKIGPRLPIDMQNGGLDLSQIAVAQPFQNVAQGADWFLHSPMDAPSAQLAGERLLPPSLRAAATAGRWAGLGPEGTIERGAVGTLRGHTPGPNDQGEKVFFRPSLKDVAMKGLGFTPLELSKQYARGRIEQVKDERLKAATTALVNGAANDLDRNGDQVPSRNLTTLREHNPQAYRELMKAWAKRQGGEQASTREIYRRDQEPKPIAKRKKHGVVE